MEARPSMWVAGLMALALAQEPHPDPEVVPSAGLATEGGPGLLWVAPSNLAYDPEPFWGAWVRSDRDGTTPMSGAFSGGGSHIAGGFRWLLHDDGTKDFSLDLGVGIPLPQRVAIGAALHWALEDRGRNYVAFDASASWRPLPWFGLTALTRNIGAPGDTGLAPAQTGVGLAVRPFGRVLLVGADYLHTFGVDRPSRFALTARVRPTRGLFLRAQLDSQLAFGGGIEVAFGGAAIGLHAATTTWDGLPTITGWIGSEERDEHIAPPRRQVTSLALLEAPPYQPERQALRRSDPGWLDTLTHFQRAADDKGVIGMVVTLGGAELPWAQWRELRSWITRLRARDKEVLVYLTEEPGSGAIYAASAATRVLAHPAATLRLTGLSTELLHLRGVLDAVGVEVQVVRRAEYKSSAEALVALEPSAANREQQQALLDDTWEELTRALADGRARTRADAEAWIDGGPYTAPEAEQIGLIDGRAWPDQLEDALATLHAGRIRRVNLAQRPPVRTPWDAPAEIAVIYVEGPLVSGESEAPGLLSGRTTGAATLTAQLDRAARDVKVRAVVLRLDSPGGSAFAADEVWRAVQRVKAAGKPVVASFGGVAASGAYYIAAGTDAIFAEPTSVTGSIGVIALKTSIAPLLDTLGARVTTYDLGRSAGIDSPYRPWDPVQLARMDALVADTYQRFKERVAVGRNLTPERVEALARGRVWSGAAAEAQGLVDHLGGLTDALDHARQLAGVPERQPVAWVGIRERSRFLEDLLRIPLRLRPLRGASASLLGDGARVLEPWLNLWTLTRHGQETLWMIDPWWTGIGPR